MGGSRCTYRNCTVRTDGNVHMFHYPVYDKVRCHQWLVNANRLDFLNLKLSQVRNRVVCQHHFKDECFMNYLKEKLTFDAIPTEDGPLCCSTKDEVLPVDQIAKAYSTALYDVDENDKYTKRSNTKANSSMVYADFLTNGDVWEKQYLNDTIWNNMVVTKDSNNKDKVIIEWQPTDETLVQEKTQAKITLTDLIEDTSSTKITEFDNPLLASMGFNQNKEIADQVEAKKSYKKIKNTRKPDNNTTPEDLNTLLTKQDSTDLVARRDNSFMIQDTKYNNSDNLFMTQKNNNLIVNYDNFSESQNVGDKNSNDEIQNMQTFAHRNKIPHTQSPQMVTTTTTNDYCAIIENPHELAMQANINHFITNTNVTKKPKVTILSQKTISDPFIVSGPLEPVQPAEFYIHVPKKTALQQDTDIKQEKKEIIIEEIKLNENVPPPKVIMQETDHSNTSNIKRNSKSSETLIKPFVVKHKIAPERVAAIEKKRNFNKRLIDIIEICLDKLEDQDKNSEETKVVDTTKGRTPKVRSPKEKVNCLKQNVGTYLSKQTELPSSQEYMMKFLEARMKKMEDTLLGKIEQNSQRIVDLKNSFSNSPHPSKATGTQTSQSEELYKKQLYKEISQFLSPNANSLVYEELFINKYGNRDTNELSPPKRRKRR